MDHCTVRLIKLFAKNLGILVLFMCSGAAYTELLIYLPMPWDAIVAVLVPGAFILQLCWSAAKSRLEYLESKEKRLADQLVNSD